MTAVAIKLYSTCPQSTDVDRDAYARRVAEVARWSEEAGCHGMLVYTDNSLVDPWLVSQLVLGATEHLRPLVAVQPVYMHPYSAAKMVASLGHLHDRQLCLNMVAGGFRNDLSALGDETPHDERYDRTVEYTQIVKALLSSPGPLTFEGRYYDVTNLRLTPPLPAHLQPEIVISGSSPAGLAAADRLDATPVRYPQPAEEEEADESRRNGNHSGEAGIRVGVIARASDDEAWRVARERFPEDRKGQITHRLAMKVSDSAWHRQLSTVEVDDSGPSPYWLGPFENYKTFCPYLVGSHERVGLELARYMRLGSTTFILDIPPSGEELVQTRVAFDEAQRLLAG